MTHGYQNSLKIVCEHIIPACERIELALSDLLGFSLWLVTLTLCKQKAKSKNLKFLHRTQRYGDFLETTAVEKTIHCIRQFVSQIHLFTKDLNHVSTTFRAFIKWITTGSVYRYIFSVLFFYTNKGIPPLFQLLKKLL